MRQIWTNLKTRVQKKDLFAALCLVFVYVFTHALILAQESGPPQPAVSQKASAPVSSTHQDISVTGTIQQVQTTHAGVHLLVSSSQGLFDAHLGSNLTSDVMRQLSADQPVQIVGFMQTVNGNDWLLVRQLTIAGDTITIRNQYGSPVYPRAANSRSQINGGAR
jgi:hypothetical protein